jgi:putative endonuclease
MHATITREKQTKRWTRAWKYDLVNAANSIWRNLAEDSGFEPLLVQRQADPGSSPG